MRNGVSQDELMKGYHGPDDMYAPEGLVKQLSKALIERAMQAELTEQLGYEKNGTGDKPTENRRNGKSSKKPVHIFTLPLFKLIKHPSLFSNSPNNIPMFFIFSFFF
jgi:hypothetical protein